MAFPNNENIDRKLGVWFLSEKLFLGLDKATAGYLDMIEKSDQIFRKF